MCNIGVISLFVSIIVADYTILPHGLVATLIHTALAHLS
jgi:hypothetical protein